MRRVLFNISLYLLKYDLRIKSKYYFVVNIFESNHPQLQENLEIAVLEIDVRKSKVKINYSELLENQPIQIRSDLSNKPYSAEIDFLNTLNIHLRKIKNAIEGGMLTLEWLFLNSGQEVKLIKTPDHNGVEHINPRGLEDYWVFDKVLDEDLNEVLDNDGNPTYYQVRFIITSSQQVGYLK